MKIIPDEIPDDAAPLDAAFVSSAGTPSADQIRKLDGKNVFVAFKNKSTAVGKLECEDKVFYVGREDVIHYYTDIDTFREV